MIRVRYSSIDRFSETRTFKTVAGARKYAVKWVGANPEFGPSYAVSGDGIGKITVTGATLKALFYDEPEAETWYALVNNEGTQITSHFTDLDVVRREAWLVSQCCRDGVRIEEWRGQEPVGYVSFGPPAEAAERCQDQVADSFDDIPF